MPYIDATERGPIKSHLEAAMSSILSVGDLTYAITYLMHRWVSGSLEQNFTQMSMALTAAECAKLEFHRVVMAPYEDQKRAENGPVSHLDRG